MDPYIPEQIQSDLNIGLSTLVALNGAVVNYSQVPTPVFGLRRSELGYRAELNTGSYFKIVRIQSNSRNGILL